MRAGHALADAAAAAAVIVARPREGEGLEQVEIGRDGLVDHDDVGGSAALISAMARAIEVGVRDQAFSTRAFCAASSASFCARNASCACPRRRAVDAGRRLPQRLEGRADIGDHAGIDREIVGQARRRRPRSAAPCSPPGTASRARTRLPRRTARRPSAPGRCRRTAWRCPAHRRRACRDRPDDRSGRNCAPRRPSNHTEAPMRSTSFVQRLAGAGARDVVAGHDRRVPGRRSAARPSPRCRRDRAGSPVKRRRACRAARRSPAP